MSLSSLLTQPLTVQNQVQGSTDEFGSAGWVPDGEPFTVNGKLKITRSTEQLNDRDTVVTNRFAILPAGTNINAYATVTFQGVTWQVDGDPDPVWNPRAGRVEYLSCALIESTGG